MSAAPDLATVLRAPFPYFGGKRTIADTIWRAFGSPKHYIEPFCGSAAVLLSAPAPASLEVIGDANGFIANFWRAVVAQPEEVARWADYPVSHVDLGARHLWLMGERERDPRSVRGKRHYRRSSVARGPALRRLRGDARVLRDRALTPRGGGGQRVS